MNYFCIFSPTFPPIDIRGFPRLNEQTKIGLSMPPREVFQHATALHVPDVYNNINTLTCLHALRHHIPTKSEPSLPLRP